MPRWRQPRLPVPQWPLLGRAMVVGVGGALVGAAFVGCLHLLQPGLWPTHTSRPVHLLILVGVGGAIALIVKVLGNPGDVELLVDNIHVFGGRDDIGDLRALIPVSLLAIAAGGAMGPEAPLVQTTASLASWAAGRWGLDRRDVRVLTITGMAAGFTVLFGAPLGSAMFALEILHRRGLEYYEAVIPALVGSLAGYGVYVAVGGLGLGPIWHLPSAGILHRTDLLAAAGAGLAGAAIGAAFTYLSTALGAATRALPPAARPVLGGVALGALAWWSPYALTFGEGQIDPLVAHPAVAGVFLVALLAKLCGTSVTLASGWRGGFIIPLFLMGAATGRLAHLALPASNEAVLIAACMAAACTAVTKTPLGATLVVTEMGGLPLLPTTLLAAVVALLLTSEVGLIHTQAARPSEVGPA